MLTAALVACGKLPQLPRLAPGDVVVAFGDSLTYGTGANPDESYPAVLGRMTGRQVISAGVPGEVTAEGLARLPGVLDEYHPKLVILCMGGNDMLRKVDDAAIAANLRAMVREMRQRNIAVVLIGVPRPTLLGNPPKFYPEIAKEFGIPYEGEVVKDILYDRSLKSDPIHPNAQGYRKMAQAVAELLHEAGAV
jgi:lysophospholipase L1-like esterase